MFLPWDLQNISSQILMKGRALFKRSLQQYHNIDGEFTSSCLPTSNIILLVMELV